MNRGGAPGMDKMPGCTVKSLGAAGEARRGPPQIQLRSSQSNTGESQSAKGVNKLVAWLVLVLGPVRNFSSRDLQKACYLLWSTTASTVVLV